MAKCTGCGTPHVFKCEKCGAVGCDKNGCGKKNFTGLRCDTCGKSGGKKRVSLKI